MPVDANNSSCQRAAQEYHLKGNNGSPNRTRYSGTEREAAAKQLSERHLLGEVVLLRSPAHGAY
jgi:hypothetical protein